MPQLQGLMFYLPQTSGLLLERLQAWKHMCGYLENYIGAVAKNEKSQAHDQEKILKVSKMLALVWRET